MRLIYTGPEPVNVPDARLIAEPGKPVNVPNALAEALLLQPLWKKAPARKEREHR